MVQGIALADARIAVPGLAYVAKEAFAYVAFASALANSIAIHGVVHVFWRVWSCKTARTFIGFFGQP
jgi:hypothetical protein